jgi:hypothetical protein
MTSSEMTADLQLVSKPPRKEAPLTPNATPGHTNSLIIVSSQGRPISSSIPVSLKSLSQNPEMEKSRLWCIDNTEFEAQIRFRWEISTLFSENFEVDEFEPTVRFFKVILR